MRQNAGTRPRDGRNISKMAHDGGVSRRRAPFLEYLSHQHIWCLPKIPIFRVHRYRLCLADLLVFVLLTIESHFAASTTTSQWPPFRGPIRRSRPSFLRCAICFITARHEIDFFAAISLANMRGFDFMSSRISYERSYEPSYEPTAVFWVAFWVISVRVSSVASLTPLR